MEGLVSLSPLAEQRDQLANDRLDRIMGRLVVPTAAMRKVILVVHKLTVEFPAKYEFRLLATQVCIPYRIPGKDDDHFMVPFLAALT